jgi:hypothetical protein
MRTELARHGRVQDLLPLAAIDHDVAWMRDAAGRAVLEVASINFALKSGAEQEAILAGYRAFLNGLRFAIQVVVHVEPTDIEQYLAALRARTGISPTLARLALDHEAFVRRLARERTLLDRRFYLVVPAGDADPEADASPVWTWPWRRAGRPHTPAQLAALTVQQLTARCEQVAQGLAAIGLPVRRLTATELVALWSAMLGAGHGSRPSPERPPGPVAIIRRSPVREVTHAR